MWNVVEKQTWTLILGHEKLYPVDTWEDCKQFVQLSRYDTYSLNISLMLLQNNFTEEHIPPRINIFITYWKHSSETLSCGIKNNFENTFKCTEQAILQQNLSSVPWKESIKWLLVNHDLAFTCSSYWKCSEKQTRQASSAGSPSYLSKSDSKFNSFACSLFCNVSYTDCCRRWRNILEMFADN